MRKKGKGGGDGKASSGVGVSEATLVRITKVLKDFHASDAEVYTFEVVMPAQERIAIHNKCKEMGMKSKCSGPKHQRRLSVYKIKQKKRPDMEEGPSHLRFSEEARHILQELFTHYPPDDANLNGGVVRNSSVKVARTRSKDSAFCKPAMRKPDIAKKVEMLTSKVNGSPHLRKIAENRSKLPISSFNNVICSTLENHQVVLISGETGCGKTTQVPQYILDHMWGKGESCKIICTQPRRISAISVAERISSERGESIGDTVGYKIRLESKGGKDSSIMFCTNGILLKLLIGRGTNTTSNIQRSKHPGDDAILEITHIIVPLVEMQGKAAYIRPKVVDPSPDPALAGATCTGLPFYTCYQDEIHERDYFSDLMLTILRDLLPLYPHLCLVLMSATLDAERFSKYFNGCPVIQVPGFTYPVKTFYLEDVLSILHSADDNHVNSTYRDLKQKCALTDDVKSLMDESINLALVNNEFDPLLEIFSSEQNLEIYNYHHSETGVTPLMVFSAKGQLGDVCMLLSFGVDCSSQDHNGKSALDWAQQENQQEICELIRKHMEFSSEKSGKDSELLDKYLTTINPEYIDTMLIERLLRKICVDSTEGAILIFLPGWEDINRTKERLLASPFFQDSSKFLVMALHSMVPSSEQKDIFKRPPAGVHKVILSTNIAETSVTIDDVVFVIDSGRMKEKNYDPYNNVSTLQTSWISKASARQREGRAGRCQPGICYHLYSRFRAASLPDYQIPEMKRMPIEELCLQIKLLDANGKIADFLKKTLDPPIPETIKNAMIVLQDLGALTQDEELTELGEKLGSLPVHPSTTNMLLFAIVMNCLDPALTLACATDFRDPFVLPITPDGKKRVAAAKVQLASLYGGFSDQLAVVAAFDCWRRAKDRGQEYQFCTKYFVLSNVMCMLSDMRTQLQNELTRRGFIPADTSACSLNSKDPGIMRAVLMAGAYPTIGRLLPANNGRRPVVETPSGVKVRLHPRSCNINLSFSESSENPLVIYDEVIRGDHGMFIKNSSVAGSYPLFLLSAEMVVAPSDDGDEVKEGSSEEKEEIMSSPDTTVTIIVDRWLRFKAMALDVAQIYCLRERLASAILFKVKNPQDVLPPALGASIYAMACILSYDGLPAVAPSNDLSSNQVSNQNTKEGSRSSQGDGVGYIPPDGFLMSLFADEPHYATKRPFGSRRQGRFKRQRDNQ